MTSDLARSEEARLRTCVRDLFALSAIHDLWIGRSPQAIADSLRDLLVGMLDANIVYVHVVDPESREPLVAQVGASHDEIEAVLHEIRSDRRTVASFGASGDAPMRVASYPLGLGGELGYVVVGAHRSDFPQDLESVLMQAAANQGAVALVQAGRLIRRQRADVEKSAVVRLGLRAVDRISFDDLLEDVVRTVRDTLHLDYAEVFELTPDGSSVLLRAGAGWSTDLIGHAWMSADADSQAGYTLLVGNPVIVESLPEERRFRERGLLLEHGVISGITVVIPNPERAFGVLGAHGCEPRRFPSDNVEFLQVLASLLANVVQRHRAEAEREDMLARTRRAQMEAEQASDSKSAFLGMMSHELRTPLNAIIGYAQLLELDAHGSLTELQRRDVSRIQHAARYLVKLIGNVLDILKSHSGQVHYDITAVPLNQVLAAIEDLITPQIDTKELHYERHCADDGVRMRADAERLKQVLLNLLSNAAKFTDRGGSIRLECVIGDDTVELRVSDTGIGIPPEKLNSVFEPFVQAEARHESGGTGLGLAISREFVQGMGGTLRAESVVGTGTTFSVVLPRA